MAANETDDSLKYDHNKKFLKQVYLIKMTFILCRSMRLRKKVLEDYVEESVRLIKKVAFGGASCPSGWYRNKHGVNWTLYHKDLISFWWETRSAEWQDYIFE